MKNKIITLLSSAIVLIASNVANAQCNWKTIVTDGFEYSTIVPHLIPGTTIHNTPQSFAVHSGSKSLYMNFVNTMPSNSLVYERPVTVCAFVPIRISAWLTTSFSGVQCNVRCEIVDSNNVVLDSISIAADYAPVWSSYNSPSITPATSTVKFRIYSITAGTPGGNDLSLDDLRIDRCSGLNLGSDTTVCNTASVLLNAGNFASYLWGNGDTSSTYLATTPFPGNSGIDYWVTTTDTNGCVFNDTIRVNYITCSLVSENTESALTIYPNPAVDYIYINNAEELTDVTVLNLTGEKQMIISEKGRIQISGLAEGIYIIRAVSTKGDIYKRSIVISR